MSDLSVQKRSAFQRICEILVLIAIIAALLGFVSCCYMLDKFRWTL